MINTKELRIGNILQTHRMKPNELIIVNTISKPASCEDFDYMVANNYYPPLTLGQCEPIPLTEEWLLKFGLKLHDLDSRENPYLYNVVGTYNNEGNLQFVLSSENDQHGGWIYETKPVEYVHQLQNLFFVIKDEELIIKNEVI